MYRNRALVAISPASFPVPSREVRMGRLAGPLPVLIALIFVGSPSLALEYWEGAVRLPPFRDHYPTGGPTLLWNKGDLNILCLIQVMDGLGRRQAEEINRFRERHPDEYSVALFAPDRDQEKWPTAYIAETWKRLELTIPVYDISLENRRALHEPWNPALARVYPQILFFDKERRLRRVLEGVRSAEEIEVALAETRALVESPTPLPVGATPFPGLVNGAFQGLSLEGTAPAPWQLWVADPRTFPRRRGPTAKGRIEIRAKRGLKRQILFQRLEQPEQLLGKRVRLSACAESNCIGKLVVALATPEPQGGMYRFSPDSPFVNREGVSIPMRILAACDFPEGIAGWRTLSRDALVPEQGKVFVVMVYLENSGDPGAAARVSEVALEILE
ncbi:MAG: hypothetical protein HUU16_20135 [Candidatus Omnitrophica bacterium]|nr:hypothetical protein [Candidatus Omnitrophota bacterium]